MNPNPSQDGPRDASPDDAKRRRPGSRRVAAAGEDAPARAPAGSSPEHREEVVGRGSGGTAGGPPANGAGPCDDADISFDPAEFDREGETSITPSQKTISGGEDWLSVNFWVDFPGFEDLKKTLERAQAAARDRKKPHPYFGTPKDGDIITLGDRRFIVSPRGGRLGGGSRALQMNWKLLSHLGLEVSLRNYEKLSATAPNVHIQVTSTSLMRYGFDAVWQEMLTQLEALGGIVHRNNLSRVDACVDLPGVHVDEFHKPFDAGWIVSRARHRRSHKDILLSGEHFIGRKVTGFSVGKSPLRLDVYDKLTEVRRNPDKLPILVKLRWGGVPECATRVELQIRRTKLLQLGVNTVEDWIDKRGAIAEKLTREWFRITDGPTERNHANRRAMHPMWEKARDAFADWTGCNPRADLSPIRPGHADMSRQVAQVVGIFVGLFARIGKRITDNEVFFREAEAAIRDGVGRREMQAEVERRVHELGLTEVVRDDF